MELPFKPGKKIPTPKRMQRILKKGKENLTTTTNKVDHPNYSEKGGETDKTCPCRPSIRKTKGKRNGGAWGENLGD